MKRFAGKVSGKMAMAVAKAKQELTDKKGENYVDTAVFS